MIGGSFPPSGSGKSTPCFYWEGNDALPWGDWLQKGGSESERDPPKRSSNGIKHRHSVGLRIVKRPKTRRPLKHAFVRHSLDGALQHLRRCQQLLGLVRTQEWRLKWVTTGLRPPLRYGICWRILSIVVPVVFA
eukprot:1720240-Lingulodinium_polyedra.AAC.1